MRYYSKLNDPNQAWAALCDFVATDNQILAMRAFANPPGNESARWRNCWFRPVVRVEVDHEYEALVFFPVGGYFRTVDRLNPLNNNANNGMEFGLGVTLGSLNFVTATRTTNTDAYGVDVFFRPDNYVPLAYP